MRAKVLLAVVVMVFGCFASQSWAQPDGYAHDANHGAYQTQPGDDRALLPDTMPNPGAQYVHVDVFPLSFEVGVPGFWRLRVRPGFTWVDGHWDSDNFIPGFWRPNVARDKNTTWVAGHWAGQRWIAGQWRPLSRKGFAWVEGHWTKNGEWLEGFWRPVKTAARGMVWEPGFWGTNGWVEGFWRPEARVGYLWVGGEWDENGTWLKGRWQPAKRDDFWVRGYYDRQGHRVPGRVVKIEDRNAPYAPGHYNHKGEWVEPRWGEQRREDRRDDRRDNRRDDRQGENRGGFNQGRNDRPMGDDNREGRGGYDQHQGDQRSGGHEPERRPEPAPREREQVNAYQQSRQGGQVTQIGGGNPNAGQNQGRGNGNSGNNSNNNNNGGNNSNNNNNQPGNSAPQGNVHQPPVMATPGSQGGNNSGTPGRSR
jgi:hypothetical protein